MKKSKIVNLVLVAGVLSCGSPKPSDQKSRLYVRGDSTCAYLRSPYVGSGHFFYLHPYGLYRPGSGYRHVGYESPGIVGKSVTGAHLSRGGFGSTGIRAGS